MAVESVQQAFTEFERKAVRVPDAQNARAKDLHPKIRVAVEEHLGELFERAFLAGSYARRVQTERLKDVDVVVVMVDPDGSFRSSAESALERLRAAGKSCGLVEGTRKGVRAVKLEIIGEFTVDLVAALEDPSGEVLLARRLPEERVDDWTCARPQAQRDAAAAKNKQTDGVFVPTVRIVKFWNQRVGAAGKNLVPSYLAESILFHQLTSACEYPVAVHAFLEAAQRHLSTNTPTVQCPGDPANYVDERLDEKRREKALTKVETALEHAEEAINESALNEALDSWAKVFGPAFPAPGGDTSALVKALGSGKTYVKGTGVTTGANGGRQVIESRPWTDS